MNNGSVLWLKIGPNNSHTIESALSLFLVKRRSKRQSRKKREAKVKWQRTERKSLAHRSLCVQLLRNNQQVSAAIGQNNLCLLWFVVIAAIEVALCDKSGHRLAHKRERESADESVGLPQTTTNKGNGRPKQKAKLFAEKALSLFGKKRASKLWGAFAMLRN